MSGQLVLFLGSGLSRTNNMPGWSELLGELAVLANLTHVGDFARAARTEGSLCAAAQAGHRRAARARGLPRRARRRGRRPKSGRAALQRLAVGASPPIGTRSLRRSRRSHTHHGHNQLDLHDAACAAAGERVVILPYESALPDRLPRTLATQTSQRRAHPEDITSHTARATR